MLLELRDADPQGADALALLRAAAIEARRLYPDVLPADGPWPTNPPTAEGGVYLIDYRAGHAVGCGALRRLEANTAEVRRMYVLDVERRRGVASAMLAELERRARGMGYRALRLETGNRQTPAIALYEARGFRPIEPFGRYVDDPLSLCFEKLLVAREAGGPGVTLRGRTP